MTVEQFLSDVFTSPNYRPPKPENPFETEEYQKFVESMVPHCHCREKDRPCDGVLAGGLCDNVQDDFDEYDPDEKCDECGQREALCNCWP